MFIPERRTTMRLLAVAATAHLPWPAQASPTEPRDARTMQAMLRTDTALTTLINLFRVEPDRIDALVALLQEGTRTWICRVPGFVSSTLHVSRDRTRVVIYGQWRDAAAIDAMRESPQMPPYFARVKSLAQMDPPVVCEIASIVAV